MFLLSMQRVSSFYREMAVKERGRGRKIKAIFDDKGSVATFNFTKKKKREYSLFCWRQCFLFF